MVSHGFSDGSGVSQKLVKSMLKVKPKERAKLDKLEKDEYFKVAIKQIQVDTVTSEAPKNTTDPPEVANQFTKPIPDNSFE